LDHPGVGELVVAAESADAALCAWISERLRPLATQPVTIQLTIRAGGGTLSVKRDPVPMRNGR